MVPAPLHVVVGLLLHVQGITVTQMTIPDAHPQMKPKHAQNHQEGLNKINKKPEVSSGFKLLSNYDL